MLNRALFVSPYDADAHLLLGRLHLRNGRAREAVDALKISLWSRETAEAHLVLAQAYVALKDEPEAAAEAKRALEMDPSLRAAQAIAGRAVIPLVLRRGIVYTYIEWLPRCTTTGSTRSS